MKNITGKIIKSAANHLNSLDKKINFPVPKRVVNYLGKDGKEDDSKISLGRDNFRLQIGKMTDDDETIYSEDVIVEALGYLFQKVKLGDKIVIQVWADLAELTRNPGEEDMSRPLSFEEEKLRIEKLVKKYFPNKCDQVCIVNVSDMFPKLFDLLKTRWTYSTKDVVLDPKDFTVVDIAKYLFKSAHDDPNFMKLVYGTKVDWRQMQDAHESGGNNSDYYPLIEIAIRLYEILRGINIQGGVERQKKYDQIIGLIWHGEDKKNPKLSFQSIPSLKSLHDFCKKVAPRTPFQRIYVENSEVEEIAGKKAEKVKTVRSWIFVTAVVASMLVGALGSHYIVKMSRDKKLKNDLNLAIDNKLKNISVYPKFDHKNWGAMEQGDALVALKRRSGEMADDFAFYFAHGDLSKRGDGTLTREKIQLMILNTIDQENVNVLYDADVEMSDYYFLVNKVIPQNSLNIAPYGISLVPYDYLDPYVYAMKNTSSVVDDVYSFMQNYDYKMLGENSSTKGLDVIDDFGDYKTRDGSIYRLALQSDPDGSKYLVAARGDEETAPVKGSSKGEWEKTGKIKYSIFNKPFGKIVVTDFLWQRHPETILLRDMFNAYLGTSFSDDYISKLDSSGTSLIVQRERFVDLLLRYIQDQHLSIDFNHKTYPEEVAHLMMQFIYDKQSELKRLGINTLPYNQYISYKDVFENTISKQGKNYISNHHLESFGTSDLYDKYPHEYLKQPYISDDGTIYSLVVVTIDGKRYLYATQRANFYDKQQIDQIYYYVGLDVSQKILDSRQQYSIVE